MAKRKPLAVPDSERLVELMEFVVLTNKFRATERTAWFSGVESRERDGEHSFQIDLVAWYMNDRWHLGFNKERLSEYAKVHDLVEIYALDTPLLPELLSHKFAPTRKTKRKRETDSLRRLKYEWGSRFPSMIKRIEAYQAQKDDEARFIYALEKLVTTINIYQDGGRTYRRVGASFEQIDRYKTPRVRRHHAVKVLFDEMRKLLKEHEHELFSHAGMK